MAPFRPKTARALAQRTESLEEFGRNLRDWLHELRNVSTYRDFITAIKHRPRRLAGRFPEGEVADAFLAAQVEFLARRARLKPPAWTFDPSYVLGKPWFAVRPSMDSAHIRALLIRDADVEFLNRNVFTTSEFIWKPRVGRPRKTYAEKLETNRLRQKRWRDRMRRQGPVSPGQGNDKPGTGGDKLKLPE